jgi:chlorobactene glucosyltransferase
VIHGLVAASLVFWMATLAVVSFNVATMPRLSRPGGSSSRPGRAPSPGPAAPRVSVVIPARNEERSIAAGVGSLVAQDYPNYEVIVVDDCSADRTGEILAGLAASSGGRLRVVQGREPPPGWLGKPHALAQGAREATGELLLFVDADVRYQPQVLAHAVAALVREQADLLSLMPRLEARGFWENVLMPYVLGAVFFGPALFVNRDRPWWAAAGAGAGNLIRRTVYDRLGGHAALRNSVVDDVRLAFAARRAGFRTRAVRAEDVISVRMYHGFCEVWSGFSKNIAYVFNGIGGVLIGLLSALMTAFAVVPPAILIARLAGAAFSPRDVELAAASTGLMVAARLVVAAALRDPLWPAWTHPIMAAVWAGIISRSLYLRIIRKRLTWRGRESDARAAGF